MSATSIPNNNDIHIETSAKGSDDPFITLTLDLILTDMEAISYLFNLMTAGGYPSASEAIEADFRSRYRKENQ